MGPLHGSIIRLAVGRDAVERYERLAGPHAREPVRRHPVASRRRVVDFNRVEAAPPRDDDEVAAVDPHERWQRELGEFGGIPANGEDAKTGCRSSRFQIVERGAMLIGRSEPPKTVGRRHSEPGEFEKIRQRGWTTIGE